ncbi:MAG: 3'(2'),5'-bisphosphate nucleotidase CysQ [Elusimicrobiota bacterium]
MLNNNDINKLLALTRRAGQKIMEIYDSSFDVELKKDLSPITLADRASHEILLSGLNKLFPRIPVLSEEGKDIPYSERKKWDYFWLIDPLDGTKEFISKNGEFTINIALIKKTRPVFGLVSIPAKNTIYYALHKKGAYKKEKDKEAKKINIGKDNKNETVVVRSRSHKSSKEEEIISKLRNVKEIYAGSALKFCLIAEGKADIYLRSGPTMEWDTAAGHCVAQEAGAEIKTLKEKDFRYNKKELLNPGFIIGNKYHIFAAGTKLV